MRGLGNLSPILAAAIDGGAYLGDGAAVRPDLQGADRCGACHRGSRGPIASVPRTCRGWRTASSATRASLPP